VPKAVLFLFVTLRFLKSNETFFVINPHSFNALKALPEYKETPIIIKITGELRKSPEENEKIYG